MLKQEKRDIELLTCYLSNYFCTNITDTGSGLTEDLFTPLIISKGEKMLKQEERDIELLTCYL